MGSSVIDMQRGRILVIAMNILNLKGSLGKGTKREENTYLFDVKLLTCCTKNSPKNASKPPQYQLHSNDNLP